MQTIEQKLLKTEKSIRNHMNRGGSHTSKRADELFLRMESLIDEMVFAHPEKWEAFCKENNWSVHCDPSDFFA